MDNEEKIFYKFVENKLLLKEFCEQYKKTKNSEKTFIKENEEIKLKNFHLENEIEKYKELLNINEKTNSEKIENNNFEYEIKIKKLEKQIDFLNTCLNNEKENLKHGEKELISLKYENNKLKTELKKYETNSSSNKENQTNVNEIVEEDAYPKEQEDENKNEQKKMDENGKGNVIVINKIFADIDKKMEDMKKTLKEITKYKLNIENKMKEHKTILDDSLKKVAETNLKYDHMYNVCKEAEHKNNLHKWKKKKWKTQIEELKRHNKIILEENILLKQNMKNLEKEKKHYNELLRKAEKKNILFFQKFKKIIENGKTFNSFEKRTQHLNKLENDFSKENIHIDFWRSVKSNSNEHFLKGVEQEKDCIFELVTKENITHLCRFNEFDIKKERKKKRLLFYSDNEQDKKKQKGNSINDQKEKFINSVIC